MDVSNASGYDGATVAADACFIAKHATGRTKVVVTEATQPAGAPGREDLRARLRPRGRRGAAPRRHDRPGRASRPPRRAPPRVIFQQPNFFGCLEPAPELAAAANDAGALRGRARRPALARRARGAGTLRLRDRDRRGPGRRQLPVVRRPALRLPRRARRVHPPHAGPDRRRDGRHRGQARLRPHAADARAAHPAREGDVEHHDEPDAARARRPRLPLLARPAGAARGGGDAAWRSPSYAKERLQERGFELVFDRPTFKEFAVRVGRQRRARSSATRGRAASIPATRSGATTRASTTCLLVAVTEKRTPAEIDRLAEVLAEVAA